MKRDDLTRYIYDEVMGAELMAQAAKIDSRANGVQIVGSDEVSKVALGVSLNKAFLEQAASWGADYCVFHHGFDTQVHASRFPRYSQERLRLIYSSNMTIAGFHFSLDAHPSIGNNVIILSKLGVEQKTPLLDWGYVGTLASPRKVSNIAAICKKEINPDLQVFADLDRDVTTIGVVTGGGGKLSATEMAVLEDAGVELYITGEGVESSPHMFMENGIGLILAGHYATEVFGIKALGEKLQEQFGDAIEVKFIDVPNPL